MISKLPVRQVTTVSARLSALNISKLPVRQVTGKYGDAFIPLFSKLPVRQVTESVPYVMEVDNF